MLSALAYLWDDPDRCPRVRQDGLTGLRYCHLCGARESSEDRSRATTEEVHGG